jgi:hypothetical protein
MKSIWKKALVAAFATGVGLAASSAYAVPISPMAADGSSASLDGWLVSVGANASVTLHDVDGTLDITKTAQFNYANDGVLVTFVQTSATATPNIVFTNESLTNSTGSAWNAFQFILLNTNSTTLASFGGDLFVPPIGTGVDYTGSTLNSTKDVLTYTGSQANGAVSQWGQTTAGDELAIDANPLDAGPFQDFALKELPTNGGSTAVPLPATLWQSLTGLLGLGLISGFGKMKKRLSA